MILSEGKGVEDSVSTRQPKANKSSHAGKTPIKAQRSRKRRRQPTGDTVADPLARDAFAAREAGKNAARHLLHYCFDNLSAQMYALSP